MGIRDSETAATIQGGDATPSAPLLSPQSYGKQTYRPRTSESRPQLLQMVAKLFDMDLTRRRVRVRQSLEQSKGPAQGTSPWEPVLARLRLRAAWPARNLFHTAARS